MAPPANQPFSEGYPTLTLAGPPKALNRPWVHHSSMGLLRDHTRKDAGQPTQTIEVKKSLTLEDVKRELAEFKADAVEVEVEDLGSDKPETKEEPE